MSKRLSVSGPFMEKTGNPAADNAARRVNKMIQRDSRLNLRVHAKGRKRRRKIFHIEVDNYQHIIAHVMNEKIRG